MISTPIPILSPTSTPNPSFQVETQNIHKFSFSMHYIFILYLISTFCSFIYILIFGDKSISFMKKFFSSFIAPFVFLAIFIRNTLLFIFSTICSIFMYFMIHIVLPICLLIYKYIYIPIIELIAFIYRHTKIVWTILSKSAKAIGNLFCDILGFILEKIVYPVFGFIYRYLIKAPIKFVLNYIIKPLLEKIIIPVCRYICSIRAFQIVANFITKVFYEAYHFLEKLIKAVAEICESIINAAGEIIKESYQQIIYPFVQLVKRLVGD